MHIISWEHEAWELEGLGRGCLGSWACPGLGPTSLLFFLSSILGGREPLLTKVSMWCLQGVELQHMSTEVAAGGWGGAGRTGMPTLRHLGTLARLGTAWLCWV